MPHFDAKGRDTWLCQVCAKVRVGPSTWLEGIGNVCAPCTGLPFHLLTWVYRRKDNPSKKNLAVQYFKGRDAATAAYKALVANDDPRFTYEAVAFSIVEHVHPDGFDEEPAVVTPPRPIGLREHCRRESGLEGRALDDYVRRYYSNE